MRKLLLGILMMTAVFAVIMYGRERNTGQVAMLHPVVAEVSAVAPIDDQPGAGLAAPATDERRSCSGLRAYMDGPPPGAKYGFVPVGAGEPKDALCPCVDGTITVTVLCAKSLADTLAHPKPKRPPRNSSWCLDELKTPDGKCPGPPRL